jgi:hypothetical protein
MNRHQIFLKHAASTIAFLTALLLYCCNDIGSPVQETSPIAPPVVPPVVPPVGPNYVPGQVVIGFVDSVNYSFIVSFVASLELTPISIHADSAFTMWIQVDSGEVNTHIATLLLDPTVVWAEQRGFDGGDPDKAYIIVRFRGLTTTDRALALIASIHGLSWKKTLPDPRTALVRVKVGQEQQWIDTLKTLPFVKWADFNHLVYVAY